MTFKFLNQVLRYAQSHFQNKMWNKNDMLEYLRTLCFSKNVVFNATEAFYQVQEYHGHHIWWNYEKFGIDILYYTDTPKHLIYLVIKNYIISMIPTLLKQTLMQNQEF